MQQTATLQDLSESLTDKQQKALEAILRGESIVDVAKAADVHRATVHRWLQHDFSFIAALNRARVASRTAAVARLESMTELATRAVRKRLIAGDAKVALTLLRGLGLLDGANLPGSGDADVLNAESAADSDQRLAVSNLFRVSSRDPFAMIARAKKHFED